MYKKADPLEQQMTFKWIFCIYVVKEHKYWSRLQCQFISIKEEKHYTV